MNTISEQLMQRLNARAPEEVKRQGELGQQEFLELMIAQVRYQDPFEPLQNGEFIAQMAQFATVEGIKDMQSSLAQLSTALTSTQALTASTLVGRSVLAPSSELTLDASGDVQGSILSDPEASSVTLRVFDAAGALVARLDLPAEGSGTTRFRWDGAGADGARLPPGPYRVEAQALVGAEHVAADTALARRVESVTLGATLDQLTLNLDGGGALPFSSVRELL